MVGLGLGLASVVLPTAKAQVQITQSSTTTDNGQRLNLKTESTNGTGVARFRNIGGIKNG
jgi:hypothetical protein